MTTTYIKSNQQLSRMGSLKSMKQAMDGALQTESFSSSYCSILFDSGKETMEWDELHLHVSRNVQFDVYVWIFDDANQAASYKKKTHEQRMEDIQFFGIKYKKADVLLYAPRQSMGRYLAFSLVLYHASQDKGVFEAFEISYPARRMVTLYMPSVYHNRWNEEAYYSVFKNLLVSLEENIINFYQELNLQTCKEEHVIELLSWIGLAHYREYTDIQTLRKLPAFLKQQDFVASAAYWYALFQFLFHTAAVFRLNKGHVMVYVANVEATTLKKMQTFLCRELPLTLYPKLNLIQHPCFDTTAYCGVTTMLRAISGMDDSQLDQQYLL